MSWSRGYRKVALIFFASACFSMAEEEFFVWLINSLPIELVTFAWSWILELGDDFIREFPYLLTIFVFLNDFLLHSAIMSIPLVVLRRAGWLPTSRLSVLSALAGFVTFHLATVWGFHLLWQEPPEFNLSWQYKWVGMATQSAAFLFLLWLLRPGSTDQRSGEVETRNLAD